MAYGLHRLVCNGDCVGIRLVTSIGVYDSTKQALNNTNLSEDVVYMSDIDVRLRNKYVSQEELSSGVEYPEVTSVPMLKVLLCSLGLYRYTGMTLYLGQEKLNGVVESVSSYKYRSCFEDLQFHINSGTRHNITTIFGLRRTGKTVLMKQAIKDLLERGVSPSKIAYITLSNSDNLDNCASSISVTQVLRTLFESFDYQYILLDEVTYVSDDLGFLSDFSQSNGFDSTKRLVISGTVVLGFLPVLSDYLFDRTNIIRTSYISYSEYYNVLRKTFLEYFEDGCVFAADEYYKEAHNEINKAEGYLQSAIADTLFSALLRYDVLSHSYSALYRVHDKYKFKLAIYNWLKEFGAELTSNLLDKQFRVVRLSKFIRGYQRTLNSIDWDDFKKQFTSQYRDFILPAVQDSDRVANSELVQDIGKYLNDIDLIYRGVTCIEGKGQYKEDFGITQIRNEYLIPFKLSWGMLSALAEFINLHYEELANQYGISISSNKILNSLIGDMRGILFEQLVDLEISKHGMEVIKYREPTVYEYHNSRFVVTREVDYVEYSNNEGSNGVVLYKIKMTKNKYIGDAIWVVNSGVLQRYKPVRTVILCNIPKEEECIIQATEVQVLEDYITHRSSQPDWYDAVLAAADTKVVHNIEFKSISEFILGLDQMAESL